MLRQNKGVTSGGKVLASKEEVAETEDLMANLLSVMKIMVDKLTRWTTMDRIVNIIDNMLQASKQRH